MMNKIAKILLVGMVLFSISIDAPAQFSDERFVKGEVLVKLKPAVAVRFFERTNTGQLEKLYNSEWIRVSLPKGTDVETAIADFTSDASVEAVQPNFYYHLAVTPDDPQFGSLWGMTKISAPAAWDLQTGSAEIIVAVIDTGIKYTHEDLAQNMWTNPLEIPGNGTDDDSNGKIDDIYGYDFFLTTTTRMTNTATGPTSRVRLERPAIICSA